MANVCGCGCGEAIAEGKRFAYGHWSRTPEAKELHRQRRRAVPLPNPSGLCMCGCGEKAPIAQANKPARQEVRGEPLRYIKGHHMRRKGEAAGKRWRGGRFVHPGGYVYAYAPDHPNRNAHGYVYEHRLVMEQKLGRLLTREERVHHINSVKDDNRPENLELIANQGEHSRLHEGQRRRAKAWERAIVAVLLDDELLERTREYVRQHHRLPELDSIHPTP